jgi:hypothetical protein
MIEGRGFRLDGKAVKRDGLDAEDEERRRRALEPRGGERRRLQIPNSVSGGSGRRGRRGQLSGGSRRRRRVSRLDMTAGAWRTQSCRVGCVRPVAATRRSRGLAGRHRPAVAEAQPSRRVQQRGGKDGNAKGPEQGLHEVSTSMTRQRAEKQAGRPLASRPAMRARGTSPVAVPLRGTRSHLSLGRSLRATRRGRRCRPRPTEPPPGPAPSSAGFVAAGHAPCPLSLVPTTP